MYNTLRAIILDPTMDRRTSLKQLLVATEKYKSVTIAGALKDGLAILKEAEATIDVICLSRAYGAEKVRNFIEAVGKVPQGECGVFILLLDPDTPTKIATAEALVLGAHNCLKEPYSVDDVKEVTEGAMELSTQFREERDRAGISGMVSEVMKYIDAVYQRIHARRDPGEAMRNLRDTAKVISQIRPELKELYYEILIERFMSADVPYFMPGLANYTGTSKATKKRAEAKRKQEEEDVKNGNVQKKEKKVKKELEDGSITPP